MSLKCKEHPGNHFKNQENFLKIFALFSNTKNLPKKSPKILYFIQIFFLSSQNHPID